LLHLNIKEKILGSSIKMPNAQVSTAPVRRELETLEGAWVDLKRLSYGQKLQRNEHAIKTTAFGEGKNARMQLEALQVEVQFMDFANCIVGHNLTYLDPLTEEELPFDFQGRSWQQMLDPRIGEEIATLIDELNNYEKVEGAKN
jgi:hypothetical protein